MTLRYFWENVIVNVEQDTGDVAPHTRQVRKDIDYEYEVVVRDRDVIDYLMPYNLSTKNKKKTDKEIEEVRLASFYMESVIEFLKDSEALDLEELYRNQDFVEFMEERYEEEARRNFEEENEAY